MSRIYEALQRADRERKATSAPEADVLLEPGAFAQVAELPSLDGEFTYERVEQKPWHPSLTALPSLAERGAGVEQFRSLRSRIYQARYETALKTILVSSGMPSEGKSFVVSNLAVSLARSGVNKILLIDADMRRPFLHTMLGTSNEVGLSDYLMGKADLSSIMQRQSGLGKGKDSDADGLANLTLISSGNCTDSSAELIANQRFKELVEAVSPHFDWVLIDSPPVLVVTDALELSNSADAVLLIARGGSTSFEVAQRTQAAFHNSRILGFVLNDVADAPRNGSYYNYYYKQSPSGGSASQ